MNPCLSPVGDCYTNQRFLSRIPKNDPIAATNVLDYTPMRFVALPCGHIGRLDNVQHILGVDRRYEIIGGHRSCGPSISYSLWNKFAEQVDYDFPDQRFYCRSVQPEGGRQIYSHQGTLRVNLS